MNVADICSAYDVACIPADTTDYEDEEIIGDHYRKVSSALSDYAGTYLVVYEKDSVAFYAHAEQVGAVNNYVPVTIQKGIIYATTTLDSAAITLTAMEGGYALSTTKGTYLLAGNKTNTIIASETAYLHAISLDTDANAIIGCTTDVARVLRYLSSGDNKYFRYYEDKPNTSSKPIQLYKRFVESSTTDVVDTDSTQTQISIQGNQLMCNSSVPTDIWVYDYMGRLVLYKGNVTTLHHTLRSGIYIVKMGSATQKIQINP